ncbi:MAG: hypothetical protein KJ875_11050, partial [Alphaproteobacteria bacterium]|nr:hypothetical protein [Alphaproteobacteria bacterium]MBU2242182.1 hypothetical protein [Alphaproteobacteria bacterium]
MSNDKKYDEKICLLTMIYNVCWEICHKTEKRGCGCRVVTLKPTSPAATQSLTGRWTGRTERGR